MLGLPMPSTQLARQFEGSRVHGTHETPPSKDEHNRSHRDTSSPYNSHYERNDSCRPSLAIGVHARGLAQAQLASLTFRVHRQVGPPRTPLTKEAWRNKSLPNHGLLRGNRSCWKIPFLIHLKFC